MQNIKSIGWCQKWRGGVRLSPPPPPSPLMPSCNFFGFMPSRVYVINIILVVCFCFRHRFIKIHLPSTMRVGVASLVIAAVFLLNPEFLTPGVLGYVIPQDEYYQNTDLLNFDNQNVKRTVKQRTTIQQELDKAIVGEKVRENWSKLMKGRQKAIIETTTTVKKIKEKHVKFAKVGTISLKEAFQYMQFYPLLYPDETKPTVFEVPIGQDYHKFKLTNKADGTFTLEAEDSTAKTYVDLSNVKTAVNNLANANLKTPMRQTLEDATLKALDAKLNNQPDFDTTLQTYDTNKQVTKQEFDDAFRAAKDVLTASSVLKKDLTSLKPAAWLKKVKTGIDTKMQDVRKDLSMEIANEGQARLQHEFTQSMLVTKSMAVKEWKHIKTLKTTKTSKIPIIQQSTVKIGKTNYLKVKVHKTNQLALKEIFRLLQFYPDLYPAQKTKQTIFELPIGGKDRKIRLSKSGVRGGVNQIFVRTADNEWPSTTKRAKGKSTTWGPDYDTMVDKVLKKFPQQKKLATAMVESVDHDLNKQPDFSTDLKIPGKTKQTADATRATVEFMVISMIAEAAQPTDQFKTKFLKELATKIRTEKRFPSAKKMPSLARLAGKSGRSPSMNRYVLKLLHDVKAGRRRIDKAFGVAPFPVRKTGGTQQGRTLIHKLGNEMVPSYLIRQRAAGDHDGEVIAEKVARYCTGTRRRRKRAACSLNDKESFTVDEASIKVTDEAVEFDVVDQRSAKDRQHVRLAIRPDELATPKMIEDHIENSKRVGASKHYVKINKGLAVHGLLFSILGAANYFSKGDNVRGSLSLAQSIHTLGGLTGVNRIVSKVGKQVVSNAVKGVAKSLKLEQGLARFSSKIERFAEKSAGRLLGAIPGVGLAFDIYFIEQDVEALANLDLNNPEDLKLLPLRVVDLTLDVSTTVLNIIGTAFPAAEVITEPLVIVLSIIRMAIDDFYIDIMEELDKVDWNSPWAGLEFIGALVKGIAEGAADFLSGGLRRQMENYKKKEDYDKKLIGNLKNPDNYFKIVKGKKGEEERIDFTQGMLSSFGGYINFRLLDNNQAMLEIGDVSGNDKTIRETFTVDPKLKDIVLGLGESRGFKYKHETAKLWFVIPVKSYDLICGANLHEKSVYGTYYGNAKNNTFYAVQKPKPTTKKPGKKKKEGDCNFGKFNVKFLTGNYHYNLYGRGGSDTFYLGPEMSTVTGGEGSDVYIIQSDGGKTIIDNFAEDAKHDIVVINVNYDLIKCHQNRNDLDVTYAKSHHIRINNWFTAGNTNYYRHMSFRSKDGVIFVPKTTSISEDGNTVSCVAVALDLTAAKSPQTVSLMDPKYSQVKQVSGSKSTDTITGNDLNNILDGGLGPDHLVGGKDEDTYIIRAKEGCDTIDNDAEDYMKTTDVLVFEVPYEKINVEIKGTDLSVKDSDNSQSSCFTVKKWKVGARYQHMLFTSSDHVVFKVSTSQAGAVSKVPVMLDYKSSTNGVCVHLADTKPKTGCIKPTGFSSVATVSDSTHNDHIIGNAQSNFLSCSGGEDTLEGGGGSDNYIVKKACGKATITNFDNRGKADLLLIEAIFVNLQTEKSGKNLKIYPSTGTPVVVLSNWFESKKYQHLEIRTIDGITSRINSVTSKLEPIEMSKDPSKCTCKNAACGLGKITYDLDKDPWKNVVRFQLKSSHCSYIVDGNSLNNYIDPGAGNGYNYQRLKGKGGSDTYVLSHGYGEFNEIDNYDVDKKKDSLQLGLEFSDIGVYFHGRNDVILASIAKPSSLSVRILNYFQSDAHKHIQIITADKIAFEISEIHPFKKVITVDRTSDDSPQKIDPDSNKIIAAAEDLKGSLSSPNILTGSETTREIEGGVQGDILRGGSTGTIFEGKEGNDEIFGGAGNDVIFAGDGADTVSAGPGDDYIYAGNGKDDIDGGEGADTICFRGDGFLRDGVLVDLNIGFGKGVDAEGDIYRSIENVYGTIHNDYLIGSDSNNELYGLDGSDTIVAHGGSDKLVGGNGKDLYLLFKASGLKIIDNYAQDEVEDTLSLVHLSSTEVCAFLVGNDLHLQVVETGLSPVLFHGEHLTVVIANWKLSSKNRHLKIVLKDTVWQDHILSAIISKFENLENSVKFIENQSNLRVDSATGSTVSLSWQQIGDLSTHPETKLLLIKMKKSDPIDLTRQEVNSQTSLSISSLDPSSHYVFALALTKCSATIAVSYTLTTYGRERACPAVQIQHSVVTYSPASSVSQPKHGTIASVSCNSGYANQDKIATYKTTCLDDKWIPSLPVCLKTKMCPVLMKPSHGEVSTDGRNEGSKAIYVCHQGYKLNGARERQCLNEAWDGRAPSCQPLNCPRPPNVNNGQYQPCDHMKHSKTYGTMNDPLEGYCVKVQCSNSYLPSHVFHGKMHPPRWESDWEIPQGGRLCRDGKWVGYVEEKCEPTSKLVSVQEKWNMKIGIYEIWQQGAWSAVTDVADDDMRLRLSCISVGLNKEQYKTFTINRRGQIKVTCSKFRLTQPKPTEYEGRVEVFNNGAWEGVCLAKGEYTASAEVCDALGYNFIPTVVSISTGRTDHTISCSS